MEDEAALRARIAVLADRIDRRKQLARPPRPHPDPNRWAPRPRGGRAGFQRPHKNRTLVIAGAQNGTSPNPSSDADGEVSLAPSPSVVNNFIRNRGANVDQLMTKPTFEREQKQRQQFLDRQHEAKRPKLGRGPSVEEQIARPATQHRELEIDGIRFRLKDDGSKLMRIPDSASAAKETPKRAKVADVEFFRTKNGNLIRVKVQQGDHRPVKRAPKAQCENFTKYGTCTFGPSCKFAHNPTKVAICKELMRTGSCPSKKTCDMSHELTYHRVPACTHFLRGNCTNSACRYPHVHVSPTARVCRAFATLGFCAQGPDCDDRHVFECPDYANHGHCAALLKGSCALLHIDRAGALRKADKRQGKPAAENDSDMSSDEEEAKEEEVHKQAAYDSESDVDTDIEMGSGGFEQQDFMAID